MKTTLTILTILLVYIGFSTFFHHGSMTGELGESIGSGHLYLLGYFAYIDIFILFYPLYLLYTHKNLYLKIDFYLGWVLLFIGLILVSSLLSGENMGHVGHKIIFFLQPKIGTLGVWLFTLMILGLSTIFLVDDSLRMSKVNIEKNIANGSLFSPLKKVMIKIRSYFDNPFEASPMEEVLKETSIKSESLSDIFEPIKVSVPKKELSLSKKEESKKIVIDFSDDENDDDFSLSIKQPTPKRMIEKEDAVVNEILEIETKMEKSIKIEKNVPKEEAKIEKPVIVKPIIQVIKDEKIKEEVPLEEKRETVIKKPRIQVVEVEKKATKIEEKKSEIKPTIHVVGSTPSFDEIMKSKEQKVRKKLPEIEEEFTPLLDEILKEELSKPKEKIIIQEPLEENEIKTFSKSSIREIDKIMEEEREAVKEQRPLIKETPKVSPFVALMREKALENKESEQKNQKREEVKEALTPPPIIQVVEEKIEVQKEPITPPIVIKIPDEINETSQEIEEVEEAKTHTTIVKELEENSQLMDSIEKGEFTKPTNFKLPPLSFLQESPSVTRKINEEEIDQKIEELLSKLQQFRVNGDVVRSYSGPLVTTIEFKPAPNVKVSKILGLQDDLAMALSAKTIRILAPIPGKSVVGIEIPNEEIDTIYLRDILEDEVFQNSASNLTVALGKDIVGKPFFTDIKKLPHLLIAGTTGSGKSVGINAMILSLLYRNDPDNLKLMLIDPKMLEFSMYEDIPHLITPVITEPMKAIAALANMVAEMERRYKLMAESRTKNIDNYNDKVVREGTAEKFPFIVVIIDELADLMMNGGKEVELSIARLAQKSRACGIHLIVATQRPSVDVVTGLIKANLPSRLSYRVGQRIDSKVILDAMGAESLLGRGDGLFTPPGTTGLVRIHAPFNTEEEIDKVVDFLKAQRAPDYDESYLVVGGASAMNNKDEGIKLDDLYDEAKRIVVQDNKTSISYLQRKLQIGYNRSANIIEQLEAKGVLSSPNAKGNREILC